METGIKSSFIPQTPVVGSAPSARRGGSGFDFFILVGLVLFVASAALAVGVFLYAQFLQSSNASKLDQLERARQAFEPALIQELTRLDDRMRAADQVLASHIAPTILFKLLEQLTLQTVSYSSFDLSSSNGALSLTMRGLAESVNSIALQADLLSKSGVIVSPIFSDISRQIGGVRFNFTADVRREALSYRAFLSAPPPQVPVQNTPSPFGEDAPPIETTPAEESGATSATSSGGTSQTP